MNIPLSSETPVGRLTQRGNTLAKEIQASLREYHLIELELRNRYPDILWRSTNDLIAKFWNEVDA